MTMIPRSQDQGLGGFVRLEGWEEPIPVWHAEPHVADPAELARVKKELQRAGYTKEKLQEIGRVGTVGDQKHNEWHLENKGVQH